MEPSHRRAFLDAAAVARAVIGSPAVAEAWSQPSALRKFAVSGLAGHLARAAFTVGEYLDAAPPDSPPISTATYLSFAAGSDLDSDLNVAIRRRGEEQAAVGRDALLAELTATAVSLAQRLDSEPPDRLVRVIGGRTLTLDDYLVTRLVELTLHVDDLCVSVGIPTPAIPGSDVAIAALVDAARATHGDVAVLRALARRERDAENALRVL